MGEGRRAVTLRIRSPPHVHESLKNSATEHYIVTSIISPMFLFDLTWPKSHLSNNTLQPLGLQNPSVTADLVVSPAAFPVLHTLLLPVWSNQEKYSGFQRQWL